MICWVRRAMRCAGSVGLASASSAQAPVLGDLFEEVVLRVEDPGDARRDFVDAVPARLAGLDVGDGVGEGEGDLLGRGRAGVADVVAADADRVELRRAARAAGGP